MAHGNYVKDAISGGVDTFISRNNLLGILMTTDIFSLHVFSEGRFFHVTCIFLTKRVMRRFSGTNSSSVPSPAKTATPMVTYKK